MDFALSHPFLATYLKYVENTESPRIFHMWAALSCVSAAMGRRCWFPTGLGEIWPNMYVTLTGPPALRKGAAIKAATNLLKESTNVKFAPNDTGGQRQGIIRALLETNADKESQDLIRAITLETEKATTTMASLAHDDVIMNNLNSIQIDNRDPHSMFAIAGELNSLIGENNTAMMTFLQEMWDGSAYKYLLKTTSQVLENALLSILAGTTPAQISIAMPPEAVGQGFTSRIIFVYAEKPYKRVARPTLDEGCAKVISDRFGKIFNEMSGAFHETDEAADVIDELYYRGVSIHDTRFLHYCDRRGDHLRKLSMALAASRGTMNIAKVDVVVADQLLALTEEGMPEALGEYGMNKTSAARQRLWDAIKNSDSPIPVEMLRNMMARDMSGIEFRTILSDFHNTKKASVVTLPGLGQCVVATAMASGTKKRELKEITSLMKEAS